MDQKEFCFNIASFEQEAMELEKEIIPLLEQLYDEKDLEFHNYNQKEVIEKEKTELACIDSLIQEFSKDFDYGNMGTLSRLYHKVRNLLKAYIFFIFKADKAYYYSVCNRKKLDHITHYIEHYRKFIANSQRALFNQQSINHKSNIVLKRTVLLLMRFKHLCKGFEYIKETEGELINRLKSEEKIKQYLHRLGEYKENFNGLLLELKNKIDSLNKLDSPLPSEIAKVIDDKLYFDFEEVFRGDKDNIKQHYRQYIEMVVNRQPVVDIGCGRGEFLELLHENNITSYGVDSNQCMISSCKNPSIKIINNDALSFLKSSYDESIGSIFSSHMLEHLSILQIEHFMRQAFRVLKKDGLLIIETLDPSSFIGYHYYYLLDPTHKTPIHPQYIKFLADAIGFEDAFIYRPVKDYDSMLSESDLSGMIDSSSHINTIQAFKAMSEKLGKIPEFALITRKA